MKEKLRRTIFGLAATFLVQSFFASSVLAQEWQPLQFSGKYEKYKYEARTNEGLLYHTFLVEPKDVGFEVSYIFRLTGVKREDLEYGFSGEPFSWMNTIKPILAAIFQQQEFKVGDKLLIPGLGSLACTGVETVASLEGKVFILTLAATNTKSEFVINKNLGLPLRLSIMNNEGGRDLELKLIEYETR